MLIPNINQLAKEIYQANQQKGFWPANRSSAEVLVLVQSELFEALEAHRKSKYAQNVTICLDKKVSEDFVEYFTTNIKDSFEDELADTIIRILDMAGAWDIELENNYLIPSLHNWANQHKSLKLMQREHFSFQSCVLEFSYLISQVIQQTLQTTTPELALAKGTNDLLSLTLAIAQHFRVKIEPYITLKLAYNKTREQQHGKKY